MKTETNYFLGQVKNNKIYTIKRRYDYNLDLKCTQLLLKVTDKAEIFFEHEVFNSYVVAEEENVYVLKADRLVFIRKSDAALDRGRLYVFRVVEDVAKYCRVVLYESTVYDAQYLDGSAVIITEEKEVVKKKKLTVKKNDDFVIKGKEENTKKWDLIVQKNHKNGDFLKVIRVEKKTFCEVQNSLKSVTGIIQKKGPFVVVDGNIKVFVYENGPQKIGDKVTVKIKSEIFGRYIGTFQQFDIKVGGVYTALVRKATPTAIFVDINGVQGRLKIDECYRGTAKKKYVTGVVYRVDKDKMNYEFSVRRHVKNLKFNELDNAILKFPFEIYENKIKNYCGDSENAIDEVIEHFKRIN